MFTFGGGGGRGGRLQKNQKALQSENAWLRTGISWKTPGWEQEHKLFQKDSVRITGWEREYPGKLQAS